MVRRAILVAFQHCPGCGWYEELQENDRWLTRRRRGRLMACQRQTRRIYELKPAKVERVIRLVVETRNI